MLTNCTITLFHFNEDTDAYENTGCFPAWVHKTESVTKTENGMRRHDTFDIRIKLNAAERIEPDDLVFFGETQSVNPDIAVCRKIASVTRNDFGQSPHWHLKAEG